MGTKRIGRVGERDAGFHSNGALPSALSCCHYGSEVFRSCRKQSYGKACLSWFVCTLSSHPSLPDSICSSCWCNVIWATEMWFQAVYFNPGFSVLFPLLFSFVYLRSASSRNQCFSYFICLHCHHTLVFVLLCFLNALIKPVEWMMSIFIYVGTCYVLVVWVWVSVSHLSWYSLNSWHFLRCCAEISARVGSLILVLWKGQSVINSEFWHLAKC